VQDGDSVARLRLGKGLVKRKRGEMTSRFVVGRVDSEHRDVQDGDSVARLRLGKGFVKRKRGEMTWPKQAHAAGYQIDHEHQEEENADPGTRLHH
jgi:hypothetical protein